MSNVLEFYNNAMVSVNGIQPFLHYLSIKQTMLIHLNRLLIKSQGFYQSEPELFDFKHGKYSTVEVMGEQEVMQLLETFCESITHHSTDYL